MSLRVFELILVDKKDKSNEQVPEKMEFEVDQVPEKLSSENDSAMAVDQEGVDTCA